MPDTPFEVAPETWMRTPEWSTAAGATFCFALSACWLGVAALVGVKFSDESVVGTALVVLFLLAIAAACVAVGLRMRRAGLWIDAEGVTVRGPLRTTRVPLPAAEGFYPRDLGLGGAVRTIVGVNLRRRRERDVIVWAMRHGEFTAPSHRAPALARWQPLCDELNALLASFPDSAVRSDSTRAE
jgi:hypothetical protein